MIIMGLIESMMGLRQETQACFQITVKPVLVATSIKQATCIKQACIRFPKQAKTLKCAFLKQAPVLSKQIFIATSTSSLIIFLTHYI